ncbi:hypothetical protein [uncultured Endozoicomonas sp.]|uniref:hypothetical protein n=1 Tax=uncultured Endozoicomonas sp. TaxID=432652 RepID=UPI00260F92D9|nr:hypothetical protein [uncultured Endozoicomonas sp.]
MGIFSAVGSCLASLSSDSWGSVIDKAGKKGGLSSLQASTESESGSYHSRKVKSHHFSKPFIQVGNWIANHLNPRSLFVEKGTHKIKHNDDEVRTFIPRGTPSPLSAVLSFDNPPLVEAQRVELVNPEPVKQASEPVGNKQSSIDLKLTETMACWVIKVLCLNTAGVKGDPAIAEFLESNNEEVIDALRAKVDERLCEKTEKYLDAIDKAGKLIKQRLVDMRPLFKEKLELSSENQALEKQLSKYIGGNTFSVDNLESGCDSGVTSSPEEVKKTLKGEMTREQAWDNYRAALATMSRVMLAEFRLQQPDEVIELSRTITDRQQVFTGFLEQASDASMAQVEHARDDLFRFEEAVLKAEEASFRAKNRPFLLGLRAQLIDTLSSHKRLFEEVVALKELNLALHDQLEAMERKHIGLIYHLPFDYGQTYTGIDSFGDEISFTLL